MQNRPDLLGLEFLDHALADDFPLLLVPDFIKSDAPITSLHFHNCSEIGFCQRGAGIMIVGEKVLAYHEGDVTFIAQGEAHFSRSADGTESHWTWIMFDPLRLLPGVTTSVVDPAPYTGRSFGHIFSATENPNLRPTVMRIIEEAAERPAHWQSAVRAHVWEFMIALRRLVPLDGPPQERKPLSRVAPALEALARDCGEKWTMGQLAGLCCMSETNFRRVWKDTIGQSPQQYLIMMRMQMAAAILKSTDRPVTDVSLSVGFDSLSSFNRLFRRHFNCTPVQWRKNGMYRKSSSDQNNTENGTAHGNILEKFVNPH